MHRLRATLLCLLILIAAAGGTRASEPGRIYLRGATLAVDELASPDPAAIGSRGIPGRAELRIIHFAGPPAAAERRAMAAAGAELLGYLPVNAYLLRATPAAAARLAALPGVDALVDCRPEWKLDPAIGRETPPGGFLRLTLSFAPGASPEALADAVRGLGAEVTGAGASPARPRVWALASPALLDRLSRLPDLLWVAKTARLSDRNDDIKWACQSGIPDSIPIWDHGIHGEGQIIGHIDSGMSWENCWLQDPEGDPIGPEHRKIVFHGGYPGGNPNHGTHTAGTLVGDGYTAYEGADTTRRGLAYRARIAHSNYQNLDVYDFYADLVLHSEQGARVHSNSWGDDGSTSYTELCYDIDRFSWDYEESMLAFAVTNQATLRTPENAKNVLAVGATWAGWNYKIYFTGGIGPTADGRRKPEIFAPGQGINSANAQVFCDHIPYSGCSMACPAVTAGAALARQYFTAGWYPSGVPVPADGLIPSGALLRAVLLNATFPLEDPNYPDYPHEQTGWGRLALDESLYFAGELRGLWVADRRNAEGLETGESASYPLIVDSGETSLKITMAFTDYPGEEMAAYPVVNDLHLLVISPSGDFRGNVFDTVAGESMHGGEADTLNMIERVVVNEPEPGIWEILVLAEHVPMGPQGYALAVSYGRDSTPVLLSFFNVEGGEAVVDLSWELAAASDPGDFRLAVEHEGERRELPFSETEPGRYTARDADPSLMLGGRFTYSLFSRADEEEWRLLRSESVDLAESLREARLLGVFPNPFNPRTTISFVLPARQAARLAIYDIAGRRVALLADGIFPAGVRPIIWSGLDDAGRPVPSGIYFARLETRGLSQSEKLLLLR